MPLPETAAKIQIRNLLVAEWDSSSIDQEFKTAWISTGWWDESSPNPQVTITGVTEDTSPDAIVPDGSGLSSWVDGSVDINVWAPLNDDMASEGVAKDFRYQLKREVHRIIEANPRGEATASLTRLETGDMADDTEIGRDPPPYSALIPVGFQYRTAPE